MFGPEAFENLNPEEIDTSGLSLEEDVEEDVGVDPYNTAEQVKPSEDLKNEKDANDAIMEGLEDKAA